MKQLARGYIASGEFNGNRSPQHIQNQIIKLYCDTNKLTFVLSRAEYWIDGNTQCQLWAALKEGYKHIVFFSLWQLPSDETDREEVYKHCWTNKITLHFATERISTNTDMSSYSDLELLIKTHLSMPTGKDHVNHLETLSKLI